ncbi:MAG TPA: 2-phosphosulfolactate phosphatase [Firmicutes bacterium]|jgi:2-phosphosulfolactate phosphatase|nr:2-phosphosulfolactate phosphatase [Bacillota bacterium]
MKIDLILASGIKTNRELHEKTVVVIDVLRASSTIITALANGCVDLLPVAEPGDAAFINRQIGACCLTGGERNGLKIPGFDLGNSPLEYSAEVVAEKRIILCTSNGTKALKEAQNAAEILIGAFLNAGRTSLYLKDKQEVVLFCAGRNGELGLDDLLCAGLIVENLLAQEVEVELTDAAQLGLISYRHLVGGKTSELAAILYQAEHTRYLASIGFAADITYCAQVDFLPYLISYKGGRVMMEDQRVAANN